MFLFCMKNRLELFAESFDDEAALRGAIQDLLNRMPGVSGVQLTHGTQEFGKDLVFESTGALGEKTLCACVVKNAKITGSVDDRRGAMTVMHQVRQCLTKPFLGPTGEEQRVSMVYVMTPYEITQIAMASMQGDLQERAGQVMFFGAGRLLGLFEDHYSDFLLLKSGLLTTYVSTLRQSFEDRGALHHLSMKHGMLGAAKRATSRAFVKPDFYLDMHAFRVANLPMPYVAKLKDGLNVNELRDLVQHLSLVGSLAHQCSLEWCGGTQYVARAQVIIAGARELNEGLERGWEEEFHLELARRERKLSSAQRHLVRVRPTASRQLQSSLASLQKSVHALLHDITGAANSAHRAMGAGVREVITGRTIADYGLCRELYRAIPNFLEEGAVATHGLSETFLDEHGCSVLVSGPPGYGKTSFCKWSALYDGERFANRESDVLPVYVPLHRFAERVPESVEAAFFGHDQVGEIISANRHPSVRLKIRLYLDGLDEVPLLHQEQLMRLAHTAQRQQPSMQVVVTSRDHVGGSWLSWLPRVRIAALSEVKVHDLVGQLLSQDAPLVNSFFTQLERVPNLQPLLSIPLLCTLTTSVFSGMTSLPEGKAELYRIFVDLLCGGWDVAKGVHRESRFNAATKLRLLIRLAATLQGRKQRTMKSSGIRELIKTEGFVHLSLWEALVGDMVQDGLLTRDGQSYSFSHLSFQEYLCAKDLADPNAETEVRARILYAYLEGDDWWREVLLFYCSMSTRPQDMLAWIETAARDLAHHPTNRAPDATLLRERVALLSGTIREIFPNVWVE
jgi:hypothetical protein